MSRRPDPRQLPLPNVPTAVRRAPPEPAPLREHDPWVGVRCDVLVRALLARDDASARGLARELDCSPDTVARLRDGRPPRPALRARLVHLAWRRLDADALAAAALGPEPGDNVRWHARSRFAHAHAFAREPAAPDTPSLCDLEVVDRVRTHWPTEPESFAAICPACLRHWRGG